MSYSTDDCKKLLDSDPATAGTNEGAWKRLSKRNGAGGVERVFSDKSGKMFALIVETSDGLKVHCVGASEAELKGTVAPMDTAKPQTLHTVDLDPVNIALADEVIQQVDNSGGFPDISQPRYQSAYTAIANRFRFCFVGDYEGELMFSFIPDTMMEGEDNAYTPDFGLPIQELMPFPEMSESPNESGDWLVGGFDGDAKACIRALLDRGFVWDAQMQEAVPEPEEVEWVFSWMAKGAKATPAKAKKPFFETDFPEVDTLEGLKALLATEPTMTLFVPHPGSVRDPDFWRQLDTLAKQCGHKLTRIPPGSELANAFAHKEGPTQPNRWRFLFFSHGARHGMEDMMTGLLHQLVDRHCGPSGASPRP